MDEHIAYGSHDSFKAAKFAPGITVGGESAEFRNFSIKEATLNPAWESAKAKLPAPGSQVAKPAKPGKKAKLRSLRNESGGHFGSFSAHRLQACATLVLP